LSADILRPVRLSSRTRISLVADEVSAQVNRLAFWRALRNIICNAQEAAGADGRLAVTVSAAEGFVVVDVDDDGPGFDPALSTPSSLGLRITAELVDSWGGHLQIGRGSLGGCGCARCCRRVRPPDGLPRLHIDHHVARADFYLCGKILPRNFLLRPKRRAFRTVGGLSNWGEQSKSVLADGHAVFMDGLSAVLAQSGYQVLATASTRAALLEQVRAVRPALCIIESEFPDGGGIEAVEEIVALTPMTKVVVTYR